jgi:capsular polysaccharide transport system permease protein
MTTTLLEPDGLRRRRFRTARTVLALMLREMSTTYGRTPGGYLWAVLQPIGGIAMLTLVLAYGIRLRSPGLGTNFPLFFATGILPFMMYNLIQNKVARAIPNSRALLFYPGVTFIDAILARTALHGIKQMMVFYIVLWGILSVFDTGAILDFPPILAALVMALALGFGIGCLNAVLMPLFPVWASVWGIATTPLFLLSGVLFTYESLPPMGKAVLWYNPLIHIIGMTRTGVYPTYTGSYISPAYVMAVSMVCAAAGLMLLRRHYRRILTE